MFLRTVKAAGGQGVQHEYVRLVEAYREDGRAKQRVVCNLGRKDLLAAHLDSLIRLLRGEPVRRAALRLGEVQATGAWDWGPMLVGRTRGRGGGAGRGWARTATAGMASPGTGRCWSAWCWSTAGRSPTTSFTAAPGTRRRC